MNLYCINIYLICTCMYVRVLQHVLLVLFGHYVIDESWERTHYFAVK